MTSSDPIADMLTRIRNAGVARLPKVELPSSKIKVKVATLLKDCGYLNSVEVIEQTPQNRLVIALKFDKRNRSIIHGINRLSTPGRRRYVGKGEIPLIKNGLGVCILTTSRGILTGDQAHHQGVGGELICEVW